jgi:XisH protein
MPAKDTYHEVVRTALVKDGWRIVKDPYTIKFEEVKLYADLSAEMLFAAEQNERQIIVEVKSFLGVSLIREFESALGQYLLYRLYLSVLFPESNLYLAFSETIYETFFQQSAIQFVVDHFKLNFIVVNFSEEVIAKWIS